MENNILRLPQKAPYGPTAVQQVLGFIGRIQGSQVLKAGYLINGGHAQFTWGGRLYSLVVQDVGPANQPKGSA